MMFQTHILRYSYLKEIHRSFQITPVCALVGPRQCGKTTLAKEFAKEYPNSVYFFDLEDDRDLARFADPLLVLSDLEGLIIIDEIHHCPDLFKTLRVLVDEKKKRHFLILTKASENLFHQTSESLAGRITYIEMMPFSIQEINDDNKLFSRGGFPASYLAESEEMSYEWRRSYIKTFLERDIPSLGLKISPQNIRRFWSMLAHYHANIFNASEIARSLGVDPKTSESYLNILEHSFMVRPLYPWLANIKKRQVKSFKIYFRDTGILHTLLNIENYDGLLNHPKLAASWEGFAMEQVIHSHRADLEDCFFWATSNGAKLDLLIAKDGGKVGYEFKFTSKPTITKSMRIALEDLKLDRLNVVVPGSDDFRLSKNKEIYVQGLNHFAKE